MKRFLLSTLLARRVSDLGGQATLVSGVNIKTINNVSVLGSGNIAVEGGTPYTHPATHPATMITEDVTHRFVTDTEKSTWNGKQNALGFTPATDNHTHTGDYEVAITKSLGFLKWDGNSWVFDINNYAPENHTHDAYAPLSHAHAGQYEPAYGNPEIDNYILSSTSAGVRSWVQPSGESTSPTSWGKYF